MIQSKANKTFADRKVRELTQEVKELKQTISVLQASAGGTYQPAVQHVASYPSPPVPPPVNSDPISDPIPDPIRAYKSESSKVRASRKLCKFLQLYSPDCQAGLIARAIIVDGRGKKCAISVSLVQELLSTPRMARVMKEYAESILRGAREHMIKAVFSAGNFTSARRLLRLSDRKLEW